MSDFVLHNYATFAWSVGLHSVGLLMGKIIFHSAEILGKKQFPSLPLWRRLMEALFCSCTEANMLLGQAGGEYN